MTTTPLSQVLEHRRSKKDKIREFFMLNCGHKFSTNDLHAWFGSAVRTRISELNRDKTVPIEIRNETKFNAELQREESYYFAEFRLVTQ